MALQQNELVLLFSGGTDSTYTAVIMAKEYEKIHLLTYDRLGFFNVPNSKRSVELLRKEFGEQRFDQTVINFEEFFKKVSYHNYFRDLFKYGLYTLSVCGLCKLAMHWRTICFCFENKLTCVCDGANEEMIDPSQDEANIEHIRSLYGEFGIKYFNPVFKTLKEVREKSLFDMGFFPVLHPKWTEFSWDRQSFCADEYLFWKFAGFARSDWKGGITAEKHRAYKEKTERYMKDKIEFIRKEINKSVRGGAGG
jgi:predicted subunit of tRNA(5-methylaminomethyl-2-thiouridylate) methyltransferase